MRLKFNIKSVINKKKTIEQAKSVLFNCMNKMNELAIINCPFDTGALRWSIKLFPSVPGYKEYILAAGTSYAINVEFGSSPHYVSAKHLKDWARRVLGNENLAYPIAKKISMKGTPSQPFFRPALSQVKDIWVSRYWKQSIQ